MNKAAFFILFLLFSGSIYSQSNIAAVGGSAGFGNISGRSPAIASFGSEIFLQVESPFLSNTFLNFSYMHARKMEYFLPGNQSSTYYPFINAYSLGMSLSQPLYGRILLEESLGYSAINDRTFSTESNWAHGFDFSLFANYIADKFNSGSVWAFGLKYGVTFSDHTASYFMMMLRYSYRFRI